MVRVAVDVMGGDHAPTPVIDGLVMAAEAHEDLELVAVGPEEVCRREFESRGVDRDRIEIYHAPEVIEMHDSPVEALRKKTRSSIHALIQLQKSGECDAIFSAGNTGAMVAASQMLLGLLPEVKRAGIAVTLPRGETPVVVMDVGANVQCKPIHLFQYGVMADQLCRLLYSIESPHVGVLNVGAEEKKGNQLVKETHELFRDSTLNYCGNVEGGDIFQGEADVIICDGFVGNIVLKTSEGLSELMLRSIFEILKDSLRDHAGDEYLEALQRVVKETFRSATSKYDYAEYGGAPLLGVNGNVLIGHGRSDARAIANAIGWAQRMVQLKVNQHIVDALATPV